MENVGEEGKKKKEPSLAWSIIIMWPWLKLTRATARAIQGQSGFQMGRQAGRRAGELERWTPHGASLSLLICVSNAIWYLE